MVLVECVCRFLLLVKYMNRERLFLLEGSGGRGRGANKTNIRCGDGAHTELTKGGSFVD